MHAEGLRIFTTQKVFRAVGDLLKELSEGVQRSEKLLGFNGWVLESVDPEALQRLKGQAPEGEPARKLAVMGDAYDALQAFTADAIQTIWFNPEGALALTQMPGHDADIHSPEELRSLQTILHKPSLQQCLAWWEAWDLPQNIRRHVTKVAWAAYVLAVLLRNRGVEVDPILAHRGGLLHDLDKIKTLDDDRGHGPVGATFVEEQGFPAVAAIVEGHGLHTILARGADDRSWETKLVYFCDKLVEGDRLVPLTERLTALKARYPVHRDAIIQAESRIQILNDEICSILSISGHEKLIFTLDKLQYN